MGKRGKAAIIGLLCAAAMPAHADVKAGVDAWGRGEWKKAVDEWRGPAVAGDADAQFNLAQAYKLGRGVPTDPALAESWFRKAALQGHFQAEDNYALALFQSGKRAEAAPWLEKGAARGEPRTQLVLGTMLFNGDGVPRNWVRAYALMVRASAAGLRPAAETLAQMDSYIPAEDRQKGIALSRQYEAQASRPPQPGRDLVDAEPPPSAPGATYPAPGARAADRAPPRALAARMPPRPAPPPAAMRPAAKPVPARTSGPWRVQLGAFRDEANARTLWSRVGGHVGGQPDYSRAGGVVRLQAAGFTSRADATRACAAAKGAGSQCVVVAP